MKRAVKVVSNAGIMRRSSRSRRWFRCHAQKTMVWRQLYYSQHLLEPSLRPLVWHSSFIISLGAARPSVFHLCNSLSVAPYCDKCRRGAKCNYVILSMLTTQNRKSVWSDFSFQLKDQKMLRCRFMLVVPVNTIKLCKTSLTLGAHAQLGL